VTGVQTCALPIYPLLAGSACMSLPYIGNFKGCASVLDTALTGNRDYYKLESP
jgi:hypothetical protein